ncbi:hypothetical protein AVEN_217178-1 [Araneus ventricosus]|uniref:Uncharacterized protein n=1 Tax=Araneus ventricosus TaxID=182803 RepID=A0A4Y2X8W1_ARAVE|nr:hypothetical protein AVEN_217178-1 [Araneus ventricosus]
MARQGCKTMDQIPALSSDRRTWCISKTSRGYSCKNGYERTCHGTATRGHASTPRKAGLHSAICSSFVLLDAYRQLTTLLSSELWSSLTYQISKTTYTPVVNRISSNFFAVFISTDRNLKAVEFLFLQLSSLQKNNRRL